MNRTIILSILLSLTVGSASLVAMTPAKKAKDKAQADAARAQRAEKQAERRAEALAAREEKGSRPVPAVAPMPAPAVMVGPAAPTSITGKKRKPDNKQPVRTVAARSGVVASAPVAVRATRVSRELKALALPASTEASAIADTARTRRRANFTAKRVRDLEQAHLGVITPAGDGDGNDEEKPVGDGEKKEEKEEKRTSTSESGEYVPSAEEKAMIQAIEGCTDIDFLKYTFFAAAAKGYLTVLHLFIAKKFEGMGETFSIDGQNYFGQGALHLAAQNGHTACVKALIAAGANPKTQLLRWRETPLHLAVRYHVTTNPALIGDILKAYSDVGGNLSEFIGIRNYCEETALYQALHKTLTDYILHHIYDHISDPRSISEVGTKIETIINIFLRAGVNIRDLINSLKMENDGTILHELARFIDGSRIGLICTALTRAKADVTDITEFLNNNNNPRGNTVLHLALESPFFFCPQGLLEQPGIDITIKNIAGKTARDVNPTRFDEWAKQVNPEIIVRNAAQRPDILQTIKLIDVLPLALVGIVTEFCGQPLIPVGDTKTAEPATGDDAGPSWAVYTESTSTTEEKYPEFVGLCFICNKNIDKNASKKLACGHIFHTTCISEWLRIGDTCPHEACTTTQASTHSAPLALAAPAAPPVIAAPPALHAPIVAAPPAIAQEAAVASGALAAPVILPAPPAPPAVVDSGLGLATGKLPGAGKAGKGAETTSTWGRVVFATAPAGADADGRTTNMDESRDGDDDGQAPMDHNES